MSTSTAPAGASPGPDPHRAARSRPSVPRNGSLAVLAAVAAGLVVPVQARLNGELNHRLHDGIAAAAISFSGGLVLLSAIALFSRRMRGALRILAEAARDGRFPRRYLLAGVLGGTFALAQSSVTLVTGVAVFTVSAIAGQTIGGLVVDSRGIGGGPRRRPGAARLTGAAVILAAAVVSALPRLTGSLTPATIILPAVVTVAAGFLLGVQQALNGATTAASGSPLAATWISFLVGAVVLVTAWGVKTLVKGTADHALPTSLWVYLGGLCGVVFIGASAFLVRRIGVLLLTMASIAGQLVGSVTLDLLVPSDGRPPSLLTVIGALLTFGAVWIASRRPRDTNSR